MYAGFSRVSINPPKGTRMMGFGDRGPGSESVRDDIFARALYLTHEGEQALIMMKCYDAGVTFPLGYANGEAMYLPVTRQLPEGGYEVDSFWEYGAPSRLAPGMEEVVTRTLEVFKMEGVA